MMVASPRLPLFAPPRVRGDCLKLARPCPMTRCRFRVENGQVGASALDYVDRNGEMSLEEVGAVFGVTRERIRQIQAKALKRLAVECKRRGLKVADVLTGLRDSRSPLGQAEEENRS
jgi:hypothetical protein